MAVETLSKNGAIPLYYLSLAIINLVVIVILILFKKLRYTGKDVLKTAGIAFATSVSINLVLLLIQFFLPQPICSIGMSCPTNAKIFLAGPIFYTVPLLFLAILLVYLVAKVISKKS